MGNSETRPVRANILEDSTKHVQLMAHRPPRTALSATQHTIINDLKHEIFFCDLDAQSENCVNDNLMLRCPKSGHACTKPYLNHVLDSQE